VDVFVDTPSPSHQVAASPKSSRRERHQRLLFVFATVVWQAVALVTTPHFRDPTHSRESHHLHSSISDERNMMQVSSSDGDSCELLREVNILIVLGTGRHSALDCASHQAISVMKGFSSEIPDNNRAVATLRHREPQPRVLRIFWLCNPIRG
jgi:hypothetical protein